MRLDRIGSVLPCFRHSLIFDEGTTPLSDSMYCCHYLIVMQITVSLVYKLLIVLHNL